MPDKDPISSENEPSIDRITAPPGTDEYERQFAQQSSSAIQRIARMPLVRIVCGLLAVVYCLMVVTATLLCVRLQLANGFDAFESLATAGYVMVMWWVVSMQGRIALYGEFDVGVSLFAPRQNRSVAR